MASLFEKRKTKITPTTRELALIVLNEWEKEHTSINYLLHEVINDWGLADQEVRLLTDLLYGTIRHRSRIDFWLSCFSTMKVNRMERSVKNILRLSIYQLMFLDRIPVFAIVDEAVKLIKLHSRSGSSFVNAVLRSAAEERANLQREKDYEPSVTSLALWESHPAWLVERWIERWGYDLTEKMLKFNNTLPYPAVWLNSLAPKTNTVRPWDNLEPGRFCPGCYYPVAESRFFVCTPAYEEGQFHIQSEASQIIPHLCNANPNLSILDVCAAPGGKTALLSNLVGNVCQMTAIEVNPNRAELLKSMLTRLSVNNVHIITADATEPIPELKESFDRIMIDAPCSSLGAMRTHPDVKWQVSPLDLPKHYRLQRKILQTCAGYLKPGGYLVYSVCSLEPEETTDVVKNFLSENPGYKLLPLQKLGFAWLKPLLTQEGFLTSHPGMHEIDGFFAARIYKRFPQTNSGIKRMERK